MPFLQSQLHSARQDSLNESLASPRIIHAGGSEESDPAQPSEIEKRLEELYRRDGREMPPLDFSPTGTLPPHEVEPRQAMRSPSQQNQLQPVPLSHSAGVTPDVQPRQAIPAAIVPAQGVRSKGVLERFVGWGRRKVSPKPMQPPQDLSRYLPHRRPAPGQGSPPAIAPGAGGTAPYAMQQPRVLQPPAAQPILNSPSATVSTQVAPPAVQSQRVVRPRIKPDYDDLGTLFPEDPVVVSMDDALPTVQQPPVQEPQMDVIEVQIPGLPEAVQTVQRPRMNVVDIGTPFPEDDASLTTTATVANDEFFSGERSKAHPLAVTPPQPAPTGNAQTTPADLSWDLQPTKSRAGANQMRPSAESSPDESEPHEDPDESPFTGRSLESGAFEMPLPPVEGQPSAQLHRPAEPARFLAIAEHRLLAAESAVINSDKRHCSTIQTAAAVSISSPTSIRSGNDPVGLRGYCPVALRDERRLAAGYHHMHSTYESRTYRFSSLAAKAAFDANPSQYAPVAQGRDVTLLSLTRESREGSLEHGVWYRGRLYLFTSSHTLETFMAAPRAMAEAD